MRVFPSITKFPNSRIIYSRKLEILIGDLERFVVRFQEEERSFFQATSLIRNSENPNTKGNCKREKRERIWNSIFAAIQRVEWGVLVGRRRNEFLVPDWETGGIT